jgi:hypothetical protein
VFMTCALAYVLEVFANFSEKARVRQVRTLLLSSRTVRGVCLPIIP